MYAIAFVFAGIFLGFFARRTFLPGLAARILMPLIYALLFCMGVLIGADETVMAGLHTLGLQGVTLAVATLLGSVVCVALVDRFLVNGRAGLTDGNGGKEENHVGHRGIGMQGRDRTSSDATGDAGTPEGGEERA